MASDPHPLSRDLSPCRSEPVVRRNNSLISRGLQDVDRLAVQETAEAIARSEGACEEPLANPRLIAVVSKLVARAVKRNIRSFPDLVAEARRQIGDDMTSRLALLFERAWDYVRDKYQVQDMSPASSVEEILDNSPKPN